MWPQATRTWWFGSSPSPHCPCYVSCELSPGPGEAVMEEEGHTALQISTQGTAVGLASAASLRLQCLDWVTCSVFLFPKDVLYVCICLSRVCLQRQTALTS